MEIDPPNPIRNIEFIRVGAIATNSSKDFIDEFIHDVVNWQNPKRANMVITGLVAMSVVCFVGLWLFSLRLLLTIGLWILVGLNCPFFYDFGAVIVHSISQIDTKPIEKFFY